jgi:CheY-like chemotaxis protein
MHKIAIIEDAEDSRDLLYYMLRDEFKILRYSNGEEALRQMPQEAPDLVVMDIWLPDMDGVEVLNSLRQHARLRNVPVLALTANAMSGDREKYLAAGFDGYESKPIVDIDAFTRTIRLLIARRS